MIQLTTSIDQCNDCASKSCRLVEDFRRDPFSLNPFEVYDMIHGLCPKRIEPTRLKLPILDIAMYTNPQGVLNTLTALSMSIVNAHKKPFWKIISDRPVRRRKKKFRSKKNVTVIKKRRSSHERNKSKKTS